MSSKIITNIGNQIIYIFFVNLVVFSKVWRGDCLWFGVVLGGANE